jgi:hypothetical protein
VTTFGGILVVALVGVFLLIAVAAFVSAVADALTSVLA